MELYSSLNENGINFQGEIVLFVLFTSARGLHFIKKKGKFIGPPDVRDIFWKDPRTFPRPPDFLQQSCLHPFSGHLVHNWQKAYNFA